MKLNRLELRNFKGIKDLKIEPNGEDLNICGENATGKTSVFDSFMWLLFDKDSNNSSNFNVKTLDRNGQVLPGLEHEVKGTIVIEDRIVELQKIYKEKWTKKRGETEQVLTGNTTEYLIDGVPKLKKEYTEFLEKIIDEETFRILTNPLHFNTKLEWKKRRAIAMDLVDEIEIEDVLKTNSKLVDLKDLLVGDLTIEDLKTKTQATKRKLNEKLKQVPVRIDELSRQDLDEDTDFQSLELEKLSIEKALESFKVSSIDTEQVEKLKQEIIELENWKRIFERDKTIALNEEYKSVNEKIQIIQQEINYFSNGKQRIVNEVELFRNKINFKNEELARLRSEWSELNSLEFNIDDNTCKTCGQELQEDKKEDNLDNFSTLKSNQLNKNAETGKKVKAEVTSLEMEIAENDKEINELTGTLKDKEKTLESFTDKRSSIEKQLNSINFNESEEYKENSLKIVRVNREIESILVSNKEQSQEQQNKVLDLQNQLSNINTLLSKKEVIESNLKRVEELKEEERELAEKIAKLEKTEMQCEQFIMSKAELLEDKLNSKFTLVKFKLFNKQVNGGVDETFITTVNGVPFEDLNNAMTVNAGLDIINTLTKHYNFNPTIFIDNREGINEIIDVDSQIINLFVSKDKKLTVENVYNPTKEDFKELEKIVELIRGEFEDNTTDFTEILYEKDFEEDFQWSREEYGYKSRWYIEKNEYYKYKGIEVMFSYQEPLTENQEGQGTNPEIQILKIEGEK